MKKNSFLLLGYSSIARKRIINVFLKNKIEFSVASKSFNKDIDGAKKIFLDYNDALLNSGANIVYISLPNSLHFNFAKKALSLGYHVIVDKPMCYKLIESRQLIKLAKKKIMVPFNLSKIKFKNLIKKIKPIKADFTGLEVPNAYVYGFGLDFKGIGRNIPHLYAHK